MYTMQCLSATRSLIYKCKRRNNSSHHRAYSHFQATSSILSSTARTSSRTAASTRSRACARRPRVPSTRRRRIVRSLASRHAIAEVRLSSARRTSPLATLLVAQAGTSSCAVFHVLDSAFGDLRQLLGINLPVLIGCRAFGDIACIRTGAAVACGSGGGSVCVAETVEVCVWCCAAV
jgi:hypothetical protein